MIDVAHDPRQLPDDHPFGRGDVFERMSAALERAAAEASPRRALLLAYADATRRTIDELLTTTAADDALVEAVSLLERATGLLASQPHGRPYEGAAETSMVAVSTDARAFVDYSPFVGAVNPLAPPLQVAMSPDEVVARGVFGPAYEGPPGCVHGGYIAAGFDEVLGFAQSLTGSPGMTGRLDVRYRKPTPLLRELVYTGRVERVDGRKIFTRATLHAGDLLTAEAEGLFISIDRGLFAQLMADRPSPRR